jgi:hypothetical protein
MVMKMSTSPHGVTAQKTSIDNYYLVISYFSRILVQTWMKYYQYQNK